MENSVKQHILSKVFFHFSDNQMCVMDNRRKNGFAVGMDIITPFVFEKLYELSKYLSDHCICWYVTTDEFPSFSYEIPCIRFFDDEDEDEE